eukprot:TRINITY_DN13448_c1_g1_i2.p1 TRINITY_DN13448_c1_g1~~TRINITY_DN13448_c1_g1_i2.p1  ORF type:complete len:543 (-),score=49.50 TRINITY_DN13448_c1_g1_i2:103-1731(-)
MFIPKLEAVTLAFRLFPSLSLSLSLSFCFFIPSRVHGASQQHDSSSSVAESSRCRWAEPVYRSLDLEYVSCEAYQNISLLECKQRCNAWDKCNTIYRHSKLSYCLVCSCRPHGTCPVGGYTPRFGDFPCHPTFGCAYYVECLSHTDSLSLIGSAVAIALTLGILTVIILRMLGMQASLRLQVVGGCSTAGIVVALGLLPLAVSSSDAAGCAEVEVTRYLDNSLTFPLMLITAGFSFLGCIIAIAVLWCHGWQEPDELPKIARGYFTLAALVNLVGALGAMLESCTDFRSSSYVVQFAMSAPMVTSLILQRLLLARAALIDCTGRLGRLSCFLKMEICTLLAGGLCLCTSMIAVSSRIKDAVFWGITNSVAMLSIAAFWVLDFLFSSMISFVFYYALQQEHRLDSAPATTSSVSQTMRHARFVAKTDLVAVVGSQFTTTCFYVAAIVMVGYDAFGQPSKLVTGFLLALRTVDSIFNDACAMFLGFSSTSIALRIVGRAGSAEVIGIPVSSSALETTEHQGKGTVGQAIAPASDLSLGNLTIHL